MNRRDFLLTPAAILCGQQAQEELGFGVVSLPLPRTDVDTALGAIIIKFDQHSARISRVVGARDGRR